MLNNTDFDRAHILHPYSRLNSDVPVFEVARAQGVHLTLTDGRTLIDGMASWWSVIHGYNHPALNQAVTTQLERMAHVMFGGLTHSPAIDLARKLVDITPDGLDTVFFSDSGSIAVEVAMKMAIQYWHAQGKPNKQRFISLERGYHGDTFGAMSVSDPHNGMHSLFAHTLTEQIHAPAPPLFDSNQHGEHHDAELAHSLNALEALLAQHQDELAGMILEPIVQGAGGMRFYSAEYVTQAKTLCEHYGVLLIADEIATGFGRTGTRFACEQANISPDILCLGKALTAGYMTMGVTIAQSHITHSIGHAPPHTFMHGPTFMANPTACAVALKSIELLEQYDLPQTIGRIEQALNTHLAQCAKLDTVANVRVLGAIGVVEMKQAVDMPTLQAQFVEHGVWVRPFGKLVYVMPAYVMSDAELATLCTAIYQVLRHS